MTVAVGDAAAAEARRAALFPAHARQPARRRLSVANRGTAPAWRTVSITGVPQGRSAGRKQRLCGRPLGLSAGRHAGRSEQGAADRSLRRRHQGQAQRPVARRAHAGRRPAAGRVRDRDRDAERPDPRRIIPGSRTSPTPPTPRSATTATSRRSTSTTAPATSRSPMSCARSPRASSNIPRSSSRTCTSRRPPAAPRSAR